MRKGVRIMRKKMEGVNCLPVIGFMFCSRAYSFEASCHSFDKVFGGGAAEKVCYYVSTE